MGISLELWRSRIGCFSQPARCKSSLNGTNLRSTLTFLSFSLRLALFALLITQCIEPNPGLKKGVKGDNTRERTRPGRAERGSVNERGKGTDLTIEQPASTQQSVSASTTNRSDHPRINDWLDNQSQRNETTEIPESANEEDFQSVNGNPDQAADLNIAAIHILLDIQRSIKVLNTKLDRMDKSMRDLQKEHNTLKQENVELKKQIEMLDLKVEHMEAQSRRENLKFFNVPESDRESWTESENKIRKYLKDDLKLDESKISIERAHRLRIKSKPRPFIVKFSFYKDKDRILQAYIR